MNDTDETRDPVERLAEQFVEQCRRGEHPSISEYATAHPNHADQIRQVFPMLLALEDFKSDQDACATFSGKSLGQAEPPPERLGDFRILRTLGHGGMGIVYEAEQESLGRRVAIKVLAASYASSPRALQRFRREAQAAARLHHSNIVSVFGVGECEGKHFYVMQYIEGRSLDQAVVALSGRYRTNPDEQQSHSPAEPEQPETTEFLLDAAVASAMVQGKFEPSARSQPHERTASLPTEGLSEASLPGKTRQLPSCEPCESTSSDSLRGFHRKQLCGSAFWRSVAGIGTQVASALHYAHRQGVLHRDVKPGNVILDDKGIAWITDFGLAKLADQEDLTHPGDAVGTLRYMAPEQLEGKTSVRSDVYSLGLTLYELLTLRPAFDEVSRHRLLRQVGREEPPRPRAINADIPRDLETIILKAIAREPAHRYETAGQLADDLHRFLDDRPIHARRTTAIEHVWRWCRRNPALAGLTTVVFVLIILGIAGSTVGYFRESHLRVQAESAQRRAEANLAIAAEAFDDVFVRLSGTAGRHALEGTSDRVWLGDSGTVPVTKKDAMVLEGLLKFYEQFAEQNRGNTQWQHETARANRRVGDIQQRLGRLSEAERAYRRSLEAYESLPAHFLCRPEYTIQLAATYSQLGSIAMATDQFDDALDHFDRARQLLTNDADAAVSSNGRFELAKVYGSMGLLAIFRHHRRLPSELGSHEAADAEGTIERAITILSGLAGEEPSDGIYRMALAECHIHLWGLCRLTGRKAEAVQHKDEAVRVLDQLLVESPGNPEYRHALARLYAVTSGSPLADHSDISIEPLQKVADLMEEVVVSHPDIPGYRATLGLLYGAIAEARLCTGQGEEIAEEDLKRSIALLARLNDEFPKRTHHRGLLSRSLYTLAVLQNRREQPQAARQSLERLLVLIGIADSKQSMETMLVARAYTGLADVLTQIGETARAREASDKAYELWKSVPPSLLEESRSRFQDPWEPDRLPESTEQDVATPVKPIPTQKAP